MPGQAQRGRWRYSSNPFATWRYKGGGGGGQHHRLSGYRHRSGRHGKSRPLWGIDPWTAHSVVSRYESYIYYALPAAQYFFCSLCKYEYYLKGMPWCSFEINTHTHTNARKFTCLATKINHQIVILNARNIIALCVFNTTMNLMTALKE